MRIGDAVQLNARLSCVGWLVQRVLSGCGAILETSLRGAPWIHIRTAGIQKKKELLDPGDPKTLPGTNKSQHAQVQHETTTCVVIREKHSPVTAVDSCVQPYTAMNVNVTPRAVFALLALAVVATAFVPPPLATSSSLRCGPNAPNPERGMVQIRMSPPSHSSSQQALRQDPLPPSDETSNPILAAREVLRGLDVPEDANRYDKIGKANGGIWRSRVLGLPATVRL